MKALLIFFFFPCQLLGQHWESQAKRVTIVRDRWGIPHIYGKTDADCVFGLMYAQCEDDFSRVEMNYIEKLGRMAEVKGPSALYDDLLIRLVIDSAAAMEDYHRAEPWLKKLLDAFADGVNYYLSRHPETRPVLLTHFEPWYPLLWTDGSIGAINTASVNATELKNFYTGSHDLVQQTAESDSPPNGSNGFALAPARTKSGHAMLYINPHVSFYFRSEVQMTSEEGLNAYGAVTWGQFFIYQGFNSHCGWMHTSSAVDVADLYAEKISRTGSAWFYEYNHQRKALGQKKITLHYQSGDGIGTEQVTSFFTGHGPIVAERAHQWLSLRAVNRSMKGLVQCWQRTKARNFQEFKSAMALRTNTSNNTVYADAAGHIAYWHGNFVPRRNKKYNWAKPVDGSNPATDWQGLHSVDETIHVYDPGSGWIQNCNSTPFTVSGVSSPERANFPAYMAPDGENFRAIDAQRLLGKSKNFTIDSLIVLGYDNYLTAFEILIPALVKAYDQAGQGTDSSYNALQEPIPLLAKWDFRTSSGSVETTLAIEWAQLLLTKMAATEENFEDLDQVARTRRFAAKASPEVLLQPMVQTVRRLQQAFGDWKIAWGSLNRYQRLSGAIDPTFDDSQRSCPVDRASSTWGCLPSFASAYTAGTKKRYGLFGNSFVCAVEFGERLQAKSILTGGESGHPESKHFLDQGEMYAQGKFKQVLFYREDVMKEAERTYHPGE